MKKNMGSVDRLLRIAVALVVAFLYFTDVVSGTLAIVLAVIGLVFVLTAAIGFCPLYVPLGISTCKKNN